MNKLLKIILICFIGLDIIFGALLILGIIALIVSGGGSVLFPSLGLVVSLPVLLAAVFIVELILVGITLIIYRLIKNNSNKLAC